MSDDYGDRNGGPGGDKGGPRRRDKRARTLDYVDYKDVGTLRRYMSGHGKIHSRKRNSTDAKSQRKIQRAIKYARYLGLLSYTN